MSAKIITILTACLFLIGFTRCKNDKANEGNISSSTLYATGIPDIDALTSQLKQEPNNSALYAERARLFYEHEGYDEAIQDLATAMQIDSLNPDYHHLLADVYLDYFKSNLALKTMERVAKLYPERIPTLLKLCEFQLTLKQHQASMRTIDQILKLTPQNPDAYFMFGMNFKEIGDTNRAINSFQTAVEINPDYIDAWINLGQLHAAIGGALAAKCFDNAIEIDPSNITSLHAKADFLSDKGDFNGAIALYRRINLVDTQYDEAYFNAGLLYMEMDSVAKAYQQFDIAIQTNPIYIKAYFFRGYAAELLGKRQQAKADYQHAVNLAPEYELAQEGLTRVSAGG
ncbi:MAG: tetratricopeptide repeat protein [Saprospiraceae bacterium]